MAMRQASRKARSSPRSSYIDLRFRERPARQGFFRPDIRSPSTAPGREIRPCLFALTTRTSKFSKTVWRSGIRPSVPPSSRAGWRRFQPRYSPFFGRATPYCTVDLSMAAPKRCSRSRWAPWGHRFRLCRRHQYRQYAKDGGGSARERQGGVDPRRDARQSDQRSC